MKAQQTPIRTNLYGAVLLNAPSLNKGAAFTREERDIFGLEGLLPYEVSSLELQCRRVANQLDKQSTLLQKHVFLASLRDQNQVLFYRFLEDNLQDLLHILYTPGVAEAVADFSNIFRRPTGCFLSVPNQAIMEDQLQAALENMNITAGMSAQSREAREAVDVVVVTDSEAILGIGDQGVGGIYISTSKAALYTIGAGIDPNRILPVVLDVGTDNRDMIEDPLYMGWKHNRIVGKRYDDFVSLFVDSVRNLFPNAVLHFEDFGINNAYKLLQDYKDGMPMFNDDIQGTGAVTLAALSAAVGVTGTKLSDQRIVIYGAGSAGMGIADMIRDGMMYTDGVRKEDAERAFWCIDKDGLLLQSMGDRNALRPFQQPYARPDDDVKGWKHSNGVQLIDVVRHVKPTVLIGTSTHAGGFTEEVIREMAKHTEQPIIFPLSNPTRLTEVTPEQAMLWTDGRALVSTGSPFPPVHMPDDFISETNNALYYPALGLGAVVSRARTISNTMILAGVEALAALSPAGKDPHLPLLPDLTNVREVSVHVAAAVARQAVADGNVHEYEANEDVRKAAGGEKGVLEALIREHMWEAQYRPLVFVQTDFVESGEPGKRRRLM